MKPFKPYITYEGIAGSAAFELSVLIQIPAGHQQVKIDIYPKQVNGELIDLVEFYFKPVSGAPAINIDQDFEMPRNQNQSLVLVRVYIEGAKPDPVGSSSGHYGDPK